MDLSRVPVETLVSPLVTGAACSLRGMDMNLLHSAKYCNAHSQVWWILPSTLLHSHVVQTGLNIAMLTPRYGLDITFHSKLQTGRY